MLLVQRATAIMLLVQRVTATPIELQINTAQELQYDNIRGPDLLSS